MQGGEGPGDTVRYGRNQGRKSHLMFVLPTSPACLLLLRMQEPTFPPSPVPPIPGSRRPATCPCFFHSPHSSPCCSYSQGRHRSPSCNACLSPFSGKSSLTRPFANDTHRAYTSDHGLEQAGLSLVCRVLTLCRFHNGTVLHALFPFIQMGSNYH